ncbi:V-set domain-containing T-cell activation inhibitor 1-like [Salminus brasiliensis]|uniref:V-set domain-containing T-cell activation inhibitor 1-like n=1 Tax=Salminus brasiliensis TaxID=930266 RepID=UPI003B837B61
MAQWSKCYAQVTCLFHEDCILPCSFRPTGAVVIHWYKQQIPVHSYYYNKDQFGLQNKHFSGRTCLFNSQIAQGNASLVLRKVKVQDRGRYKCYTSTRKGNQETFVNLGVKALIQLVKIELTEDKATCLAQNIYPAPHLFWSTEPPTDSGSLHNYTRNTPDSKGLFTIESTVSVLGNISQHAYFCSVVSADGSQVWTASVKRQDELFGEEGSTLLIPCMVPQPRHNFTLTWTFIRTNDPVIIFTYDSRTRRISNSWENKAELDIEQAHMGNGSLTLLSPDSLGHTGVYTCTFSSFQIKHQVQTHVNVTVRVTGKLYNENICRRSWWGTAASVFIFVLTISVALSRCLRFRGDQQMHANSGVRKQDDRRIHRSGS